MATTTAKSIRKRKRKLAKEKVCRLCESNVKVIDYKDTDLLRRYQTEQGKILPPRITGNCAYHQKLLSKAIKRARNVALVP
ncbi:MAG: 30S ribosomal protein S18 [Verrucomicrobiota bacterium]